MMTSILLSHPPTRLLGVNNKDNFNPLHKASSSDIIGKTTLFVNCPSSDSPVHVLVTRPKRNRVRDSWTVYAGQVDDGFEGSSDGDNSSEEEKEADDDDARESGIGPMNSDLLREKLEKIVGTDDSSFSGMDLATLIRNKYGRSYDVQLIKKEFMGRNLLALNVMWKYMEQRSFPLTEEEYILRLDDVANTLKCWGAVSHIRNSLEKSKERPRIGKAVSIFIDMDESGGRANEWIYK